MYDGGTWAINLPQWFPLQLDLKKYKYVAVNK